MILAAFITLGRASLYVPTPGMDASSWVLVAAVVGPLLVSIALLLTAGRAR